MIKGHYLILFGEEKKSSISDFLREAFEFEENIDYDLIEEWQSRLASFYLKNYCSYRDFHRDFEKNYPNCISYNEFREWIKGKVNYTQNPEHLKFIGQLMNDSFFMENFRLINLEGRKIHIFNIRLGKKIKKLVRNVLEREFSWNDYSEEERLLIEKIDKCIFKILNISKNSG
ncbi:MAG: hypothetical protein P8Y97_19815 [Candidatus Lokiarchaeota archaeon]